MYGDARINTGDLGTLVLDPNLGRRGVLIASAERRKHACTTMFEGILCSYELSGSAPDSCVEQWSDRSAAANTKIPVKVIADLVVQCLLTQGTAVLG